jgi:2-dehydro-3-deoxy-D-arabinonate dehydratase
LSAPTVQLVRIEVGGQARWVSRTADSDSPLAVSLDDLLRGSIDEARAAVESAAPTAHLSGALLAPIESQEVWAAGVTYERSRDGRVEESTQGDIYERVYQAQRPEVFLKATAQRVVGDGALVGVRTDSPWNVPEAELGLVLNAAGEIFGYVPGNDVSSRSIEGENPLYLPQAKVYERSCAIGPGIVPVWAAPELPFPIALRVQRGDVLAFEGSTTTASMTRGFEDLAAWLMAALDFPVGAVLLTGTGIVPDNSFTLQAGDVVTVDIAGIGALTNPVVLVGRNLIREEP